MAELGTHTLYVMLVLSAWSFALSVVGARRGSDAMVHAARKALYALALLGSLAIVALTHAFVVSDFSVQYVQHYSDRAMPLFYKITAVWGGQEGSLLFWAWLLGVLGAWAVHRSHRQMPEETPWVIAIISAVLVFFCLMLLLPADPFRTFLTAVPQAGQGLNPLLQNAYMVTHPPALYVGYVGMTIPFAYALAALITGRLDERWVAAVRPFVLGSWYFLGLGLALGMLWAYEELGWGGYWAWDPVENAGLIPWLTATALLHSMLMQERRGLFRIWTLVLAVLTFELTIFGTFLTRSGLIDSVHAFARSSIGWYFLGFMALVAVLATGLLLRRLPRLRAAAARHDVLSAEMFLAVTNWLFVASAFLIIVLTIFPNISQLFGDKVKISPAAFNRWMVPVGIALLALTALGPLLPWRRAVAGVTRRLLTLPLASAVLVTGGVMALGVTGPVPLVTFALVTVGLVLVGQDLFRGTASCRRRLAVGPMAALGLVLARNLRRYGAYTVHVGVLMMYLGFAGEAFKQETDAVLARGERRQIGRYTLRFDGAEITDDPQKEALTARLSLYEDGRRVGLLEPARWLYHSHESQPTSEVAIRRSLREDLFVALGEHDPGRDVATFKVVLNPLVNWIWLGFLVLSVGALLALVPARLLVRRRTLDLQGKSEP